MPNDDALLQKRFLELAEKAYARGTYTFTNFLGLAEQDLFALVRRELVHVPHSLFGGCDGCERVMVRFGDRDLCGYDQPFPILCVKAAPLSQKFADKLTHRDFLGALMNLRIKREAIGDILVGEGLAVAFLWEPVFQPVLDELAKVGRVGVTLTPGLPEQLPQAHSFAEINGTVSSLRLDSITALVTRQGRDAAARLIRSGQVSVNALAVDSVSRRVDAGDTISIRGHGKFIVREIGAPTKKDRLHITCLKYI